MLFPGPSSLRDWQSTSMANVLMRLRDSPQLVEAEVDPAGHFLPASARQRPARDWAYDVPTIGTVYGTALNFRGALAALGDAVNAAPYNVPPKAPVLYIKPANTWIGYGAPIPLPSDIAAVQIGATLGIVIGRAACRVPVGRALDFVTCTGSSTRATTSTATLTSRGFIPATSCHISSRTWRTNTGQSSAGTTGCEDRHRTRRVHQGARGR